MGKYETILLKILSGTSDKNVLFTDVCWLLKRLHFDERIKGSHHIFTRDEIEEIINIQPKGKLAKPYQVKQIRTIILKYKLGDLSYE
jgi:hypothetical protein